MTLHRDYSLAEIDAMRDAVRGRMAMKDGCDRDSYLVATVEAVLLTYMMAGVTLADLRGGVVREPDPFEGD